MDWQTASDAVELAALAAGHVVDAIMAQPDIALALPTGKTPVDTYSRLISVCAARQCSFAEATVFALDEYVDLPPDDPRSFAAYLRKHLIDRVDLPSERFVSPRSRPWPEGGDEFEALAAECERYERSIAAAGGLDLVVLGLGANGHIAFNEPDSSFQSRTRVVTLTAETRRANAEAFGEAEKVPRQAITMGIATILDARRIILLVAGPGKRPALERLRGGSIDEALPASALHLHSDVLVIADRAAMGTSP